LLWINDNNPMQWRRNLMTDKIVCELMRRELRNVGLGIWWCVTKPVNTGKTLTKISVPRNDRMDLMSFANGRETEAQLDP
jgi:hypothetical protein